MLGCNATLCRPLTFNYACSRAYSTSSIQEWTEIISGSPFPLSVQVRPGNLLRVTLSYLFIMHDYNPEYYIKARLYKALVLLRIARFCAFIWIVLSEPNLGMGTRGRGHGNFNKLGGSTPPKYNGIFLKIWLCTYIFKENRTTTKK